MGEEREIIAEYEKHSFDARLAADLLFRLPYPMIVDMRKRNILNDIIRSYMVCLFEKEIENMNLRDKCNFMQRKLYYTLKEYGYRRVRNINHYVRQEEIACPLVTVSLRHNNIVKLISYTKNDFENLFGE